MPAMSTGTGTCAVHFMNAVAEQLTGWTQNTARGRSLDAVFRIVNEHSRQTVDSPVTRVLREGVTVGLANLTLLIALTGWGQDDDNRRSQHAGFDHHLTKPVDPEVLVDLISPPSD